MKMKINLFTLKPHNHAIQMLTFLVKSSAQGGNICRMGFIICKEKTED